MNTFSSHWITETTIIAIRNYVGNQDERNISLQNNRISLTIIYPLETDVPPEAPWRL